MSRFMVAACGLPVMVLLMLVFELTLGRVIDTIAYQGSVLAIVGSKPEITTPILESFAQVHYATVVMVGGYIVFMALCAVADVMYSREIR